MSRRKSSGSRNIDGVLLDVRPRTLFQPGFSHQIDLRSEKIPQIPLEPQKVEERWSLVEVNYDIHVALLGGFVAGDRPKQTQ